MIKFYSLALTLLALLSAKPAYPGDSSSNDRDDEDCAPVVHPVCFNIFCSYEREEGGKHSRCQAASTFTQLVTEDGEEVFTRSATPFNPSFEVQCDNKVSYNGPALRYTDYLGTRLQGIPGPFPAILLPPGALDESHHYSDSSLEWENKRLDGYCYIYTEPRH